MFTTNDWYLLLCAAVLALAVFALGWQASTAWHAKQAAPPDADPADEPVPMPTWAGWMEAPVAGAGVVSVGMALAMADAAYRLGAGRREDDDTAAEVAQIWAEVEADPGKWGHQ